MNNPPAKWKFVLAALPPLLILLALPLKPLLISALGTEVTLAVRPVDPRDLFRGDYVALSFEIESVPVALFQPERGGTPEQAAKRRSEWYVTLAPGPEGLWIPVRVTPKLTLPESHRMCSGCTRSAPTYSRIATPGTSFMRRSLGPTGSPTSPLGVPVTRACPAQSVVFPSVMVMALAVVRLLSPYVTTDPCTPRRRASRPSGRCWP